MIDISDKEHQPSMEEIEEFIGNPLFHALCVHMEEAYKALVKVEFSRDSILLGWNVRFYKAGRTLCRLYPRTGYFTVLVVVGSKEKERVEALLPQMSDAMREIYQNTREGMGQRWLLVDLAAPDATYQDVLKLIAIRRESESKMRKGAMK